MVPSVVPLVVPSTTACLTLPLYLRKSETKDPEVVGRSLTIRDFGIDQILRDSTRTFYRLTEQISASNKTSLSTNSRR